MKYIKHVPLIVFFTLSIYQYNIILKQNKALKLASKTIEECDKECEKWFEMHINSQRIFYNYIDSLRLTLSPNPPK